ncbi:asparagine synthetase B family protein [Streptomyces spectabilis]|uniref:asparagine synthase (glutamine-hydrolyzing) n=1 Tax=Streptomyces spectabilis TaxID=68270 RepID=A0A516RHP9_STRST|nr:asparagine synthetase B [Streptomyces spectabilis]QDQ15181.1 asparagine synthetase B [Streptomyces spectabilis]
MSAVFGWWTHRGGLDRTGPAAIAAMVESSRRGGPHRSWTSEHAVLAAGGDPAQENGPLVSRGTGSPVVVVVDGYLHGSRNPARTLLDGYLAENEVAAERWQGAFAFAVWDGRTGELVLGRDRLGIKPLSYMRQDDGVVFASEAGALAAHPDVPVELDGAGLSALLTQLRRPGHGTLRGMREVPPGTTVRFSAAGERRRRYWSLEAFPHTESREETIGQVRKLLDEVVHDDLGDADPAVLLSGGLDSSVLTGLVAEAVGRPPRTFTVSFGGTASAVPDLPYAEEVVRFWRCDHERVTIEPDLLSQPGTLTESLLAKDWPTPFGDKNITPYLFSRHVGSRTPIALSGEGADAMFGGLGPEADEKQVLTTFPWIARARAMGMPHGLGTGLLQAEVLRDIDIAEHVESRFAEALEEVPQVPGEDPVDRLGRQTDYLTATRLLEQTVLHSERMSAAAGLELRFPFADHRLFTLLYNVPARWKSFDGREKSLLRALGAPLVPPSVLSRRKVPYPITYDRGYKQALVERLRTLLNDPSAPVYTLLDREHAKRYVTTPRLLDRGGWLGRADVEMVLQLDAWLRHLRVRLAL